MFQPAFIRYAADKSGELRQAAGDDSNIGIDFHGAIPRKPRKCSSTHAIIAHESPRTTPNNTTRQTSDKITLD